MLRKILLPLIVIALLILSPLTAHATPVTGTDPLATGCYLYAPTDVNEGQTFTMVVKCHGVASSVYGFEAGTTFTAPSVTVNGATAPVASEVGSAYTPGNFVLAGDLSAVNSLSGYYAVTHTGSDSSTGDFTLGTFDATVPFGIVANSSVGVDLSDLKLSDSTGAPISVTLSPSSATVTVHNLFVALRAAGTITVQSDGVMTNIRSLNLGLDGGNPSAVTTTAGSSNAFSVSSYQYAQDKTTAAMSISMTGHLSCTKTITLLDGADNLSSVFGSTYTLKAGDVNGDGTIDINDATLVGGYFGTARSDGSDVNGDGQVNIYDLVHIGRNYTATSGTCS